MACLLTSEKGKCGCPKKASGDEATTQRHMEESHSCFGWGCWSRVFFLLAAMGNPSKRAHEREHEVKKSKREKRKEKRGEEAEALKTKRAKQSNGRKGDEAKRVAKKKEKEKGKEKEKEQKKEQKKEKEKQKKEKEEKEKEGEQKEQKKEKKEKGKEKEKEKEQMKEQKEEEKEKTKMKKKKRKKKKKQGGDEEHQTPKKAKQSNETVQPQSGETLVRTSCAVIVLWRCFFPVYLCACACACMCVVGSFASSHLLLSGVQLPMKKKSYARLASPAIVRPAGSASRHTRRLWTTIRPRLRHKSTSWRPLSRSKARLTAS